YTLNTGLAFAYVETQYAEPGTVMDMEILGNLRKATVLADPAYDPNNEKLRA
ncbi:MAG: hypothetical protein HON65_08900, partial [Rhodospirillales bacterium]|nr:hypothetical protein [Rhodospirillales bacterium]